ncbi:MAG: hypothetical protein WCZ87_00190 [Thiohalobacteraceae bacterium]
MPRHLTRWIKRYLYRHDYERMARLAAEGNYHGAAILADLLGEVELKQRYMTLHRTYIIIAQSTRVARTRAARFYLEESIRLRRS